MRVLLAVLSTAPMLLVWAFAPLLGRSRRGIVFGVTLPLTDAASPEVQVAIARFRDRVLVLGLPFLGITAAAAWNTTLLPYLPVTIPLFLALTFLFWFLEHRRLRPIAAQVPTERSASLIVGSRKGLRLALTLLAAFVPLAGEAFWLHGHWGGLPARWPTHWNAAGHADVWSTLSAGGVYGPLLTGALVLVVLTAILLLMLYASGPGRAERHSLVAPLVLMGWLVAAMFLLVGLLPVLSRRGEPWMLGTMLLPTVATLGGVAWLLVRAFRMAASTQGAAHDGTPDSMWHGGLFYYNPADAALLVPKRFGWGWTFNFARPLSWVFLAVLIGIAMAPVLLGVLR